MHWSEKTPILFYNQERMCESNEPQKKKKNFELKGLVPMKKPKEGTFFQLRET